MNLINQPTLRPTRKMAAVGWTSLLGQIVAAVIAPWLPGLSDACGGEVGASLVAGGLALAQGVVNFVADTLSGNASSPPAGRSVETHSAQW